MLHPDYHSASGHPAAPLPEVSTTNDGCVDVRVGQRFSRNVEWLMRRSSTRQSTDKHETSRPCQQQTWPIKLNIVIQIVGSRGDVQPFIALGAGLQKHGHRVQLATHVTFEYFVTSTSLEFYPLSGDPAEPMSYMVRNPDLIPSMKSLRAGDIQKKRAIIAQILDGSW